MVLIEFSIGEIGPKELTEPKNVSPTVSDPRVLCLTQILHGPKAEKFHIVYCYNLRILVPRPSQYHDNGLRALHRDNKAVHYVVGRFTMWQGGSLCGRAVYCVAERCTVWYGGVLCGRAVYYVVGRFTMW